MSDSNSNAINLSNMAKLNSLHLFAMSLLAYLKLEILKMYQLVSIFLAKCNLTITRKQVQHFIIITQLIKASFTKINQVLTL